MRAKKASTRALLYVVLAVATIAVYAQVAQFEFLNYDDGEYVSDNGYVKNGIDAKTLRWAFTTSSAANWHPLTWISHMADWSVFGEWAGGHHLTSVVLHVANALLLLLFLERATGSTGRSAFVAALFALHPLHVESVAWIAERKDVLSTLFWMLTLLAYLAYTKAPSATRYALVAASLAAGLMAKPMLVTLPLVLLLLDFWPLARLGRGAAREKIPLLALSLASCVITFVVQRTAGAMGSSVAYPLTERVGNALVSYVAYLLQMLWPFGLSIFYPHPHGSLPVWKPAVCAILLALVTFAVVRQRRTRPYLLVGWLWYLGTLVPVIGLVQVGLQARADRYTYVPLIGIFVIVAWGGYELAQALLRSAPRRAMGFGAAGIVLLLATATAMQVSYWRDSMTIFRHSIDVVGEHDVAHVHIGLALESGGDRDTAIEHYRVAARLNRDTSAYYFLANALADKGDVQGATEAYRAAIRSEPWFEPARYSLGVFLMEQGNVDEAIQQFRDVLAINPRYAEAEFQWGLALTSRQQWAEAGKHFEAAVRIAPDFGKAHYNLALTRYLTGDYAGARREVEIAQSLGYVVEQRFLDMLREKGV